MTKEAYDKIAEGLNEALSVVTKPIEPDANAGLVERLKSFASMDQHTEPKGTMNEAAALIQQLTAERDMAISMARLHDERAEAAEAELEWVSKVSVDLVNRAVAAEQQAAAMREALETISKYTPGSFDAGCSPYVAQKALER